MIEVKISERGLNLLERNLLKLKEFITSGRLRKSLIQSVVGAWKESIKQAGIVSKTGRLMNTYTVKNIRAFDIIVSFTAPHAVYQYYGTNPSPGRYIKKINRRVSKKKVEYYRSIGKPHLAGIHPGVHKSPKGTSRPIRDFFEPTLQRVFDEKFTKFIVEEIKRVVK